VELRRVRELQPYIGKTVEAKIIELDRNRNNVVLSRRAWLEETQKEQRGDFLNNLKPGERRHGVISSVVNFGAFVDLGGMDGLIHVSELSWKHIDHPSQVVAVGDEVDVEVLDVDFSKERISLSLKATQSDPWQVFADSHAVDQLVYGRVTKLVPFGAFVQVGEGIEGLVHISEMAAHHVDRPTRSSRPARSCGSRSSNSTPRAAASACRSSRPPRVARSPRSTARPSASTPTTTEGNYIGGIEYGEFTPETEAQAAWAEYAVEVAAEVEATRRDTRSQTIEIIDTSRRGRERRRQTRESDVA
jgi:small subunit ribosomal protein S1